MLLKFEIIYLEVVVVLRGTRVIGAIQQIPNNYVLKMKFCDFVQLIDCQTNWGNLPEWDKFFTNETKRVHCLLIEELKSRIHYTSRVRKKYYFQNDNIYTYYSCKPLHDSWTRNCVHSLNAIEHLLRSRCVSVCWSLSVF